MTAATLPVPPATKFFPGLANHELSAGSPWPADRGGPSERTRTPELSLEGLMWLSSTGSADAGGWFPAQPNDIDADKSGGLTPKIQPLLGSLQLELKRCGKSVCRCRNGRLHGPYVRRIWWEEGKRRRRYVRADRWAGVLRGIAAWRLLHPPTWSTRQALSQLRLKLIDVDRKEV